MFIRGDDDDPQLIVDAKIAMSDVLDCELSLDTVAMLNDDQRCILDDVNPSPTM